MGGAGFPFGEQNDPGAALSVFGGVRGETGEPVISALGFAGALAAAAMVGARGRGVIRTALLVFAWTSAVVLSLVVPDYRALVAVAYAPIFLVGAPFGWPPVSFFEAIPWPVIDQFVCIGGGMGGGATAVAFGRLASGARGHSGRARAGDG